MTRALAALFAPMILAFCITAGAAAQPAGPDLAAQRAAMERLAWMEGGWAGEARLSMPGGPPRIVHQSERASRALDGLLLAVEGRGFATAAHDEPAVFAAYAVLSYDDQRGQYEFRAYNDGRATTAPAHFTEDGALVWSIEGGPVRIRYTITHPAPDRWVEQGEMSRDSGATWTRFIEMDLRRAR